MTPSTHGPIAFIARNATASMPSSTVTRIAANICPFTDTNMNAASATSATTTRTAVSPGFVSRRATPSGETTTRRSVTAPLTAASTGTTSHASSTTGTPTHRSPTVNGRPWNGICVQTPSSRPYRPVPSTAPTNPCSAVSRRVSPTTSPGVAPMSRSAARRASRRATPRRAAAPPSVSSGTTSRIVAVTASVT